LWSSGDADADVLNLLYPNADRGTNGYCYGPSHSYTYINANSDCHCHFNVDTNADTQPVFCNRQLATVWQRCCRHCANGLRDSPG
jgi:hypothetical protein